MVGTPGPANLLIMSAGAQYGFRDCLPFGLGLIAGKLMLNLAMAIGLGTLLIFHPVFAKHFGLPKCLVYELACTARLERES